MSVDWNGKTAFRASARFRVQMSESERLGSRKMGQSQTCSDLAKICGSFELERMRAQAPKFSENLGVWALILLSS